MAPPTSTISLVQTYLINQVDSSFNAATIAAGTASVVTTSGSAYLFGGASKTEILIVVGTTSVAVGTLQFTWNVYEPTTGSVISTYNGSAITTAMVDHIGVYNAGTIVGVAGYLTCTTTSTALATFSPVTARVYCKF